MAHRKVSLKLLLLWIVVVGIACTILSFGLRSSAAWYIEHLLVAWVFLCLCLAAPVGYVFHRDIWSGIVLWGTLFFLASLLFLALFRLAQYL